MQDHLSEPRVALDTESYQELWQNARDASLIVDPSNGDILDVNHAAETLYELSRADLLSKTIFEIRPGSPRERVEAQMREALERGINFEAEHHRANGAVIHVSVASRGVAIAGKTVLHSSIHDITARVVAERSLAQSEARLRDVVDTLKLARDAADIGIWTWNFCDDSVMFDSRMRAWYAIPDDLAEDLQYAHWRTRLHPDDVDGVEQRLFQAVQDRTLFRDEFRIVNPDGSYRDIHSGGVIEYDEHGKPSRMVGINQDITEQKAMERKLRETNQELEHIARIDALTGVPNRLAGLDYLRAEFERMRRTRQTFGVLMVDVDNFKDINDTYGHLEGDRVLVHIARTMRDAMRQSDILSRFGGEEFIAILPGADLEGARRVAESLREAIEHSPSHLNNTLTVSVGVAAATPDDTDEMAAVSRADHRMYEAKYAGRNRVSW